MFIAFDFNVLQRVFKNYADFGTYPYIYIYPGAYT
ncbi:hypothetical protein YSP2_104 [Salmonella phage YSP2]|uniref:Uncharacterized protein n=1 Tax=Salmonella phage YSP2 TaxID=2053686 RepID=A0A2H4P6M9_9CAUD|nr:hypothetical protein HOS51_gp87 [Salmonella phage YSP2]ATW57846.1 hypothetical protein YSP2_104 [Salmonella phage YSP2]